MSARAVVLTGILLLAFAPRSMAQQPSETPSPWHVMHDATIYGLYNHQGGPRGGDEFRAPNWWMGMFGRPVKSSQFTVHTMLSLDAASVGKKGYREIFQVGESYEGQPLVDYQHPHDLFMQLAASWRVPLGSSMGFTIAGGPSAEPALGPPAFMHRASASDNPMAPLSHHALDSTHIAFGVVTAAVDRGPWTFEASVFNGREPDDDRWDFDFGPLDSYSGRVWYRLRERWEFQVSSAFLKEPEELDHGDIVRTTASASWLKQDGRNLAGVTAAFGINATDGDDRRAWLLEATHRARSLALYTRLELVDVESDVLAGDHGDAHQGTDLLGAATFGAVRHLPAWRGVDSGVGAAVTFYGVPEALRHTHGHRPVSFQAFVRLSFAGSAASPMWNMYLTKPMQPASLGAHAGHTMP